MVRLPRLRHVRVVGRRRHLARAAQHARRRAGEVARLPGREVRRLLRRRAEPRLRLLERRRRAVERVGREVGPAVVGHLEHRDRRRLQRVEHDRRDHLGVVLARAAAHHGAIVELVGEAEPRLDVVRVLRPPLLHERLELAVLGEGVRPSGRSARRGSASACSSSSSRPARRPRSTAGPRRRGGPCARRAGRCARAARSPPGSRCRR